MVALYSLCSWFGGKQWTFARVFVVALYTQYSQCLQYGGLYSSGLGGLQGTRWEWNKQGDLPGMFQMHNTPGFISDASLSSFPNAVCQLHLRALWIHCAHLLCLQNPLLLRVHFHFTGTHSTA